MSMTFMVTVDDDGEVTIHKLSDPVFATDRSGMLAAMRDPSFLDAHIADGERVDIHVKLDNGIKRDLIVTLLDDTVPAFQTPAEAEAWMAERQAGRSVRYG